MHICVYKKPFHIFCYSNFIAVKEVGTQSEDFPQIVRTAMQINICNNETDIENREYPGDYVETKNENIITAKTNNNIEARQAAMLIESLSINEQEKEQFVTKINDISNMMTERNNLQCPMKENAMAEITLLTDKNDTIARSYKLSTNSQDNHLNAEETSCPQSAICISSTPLDTDNSNQNEWNKKKQLGGIKNNTLSVGLPSSLLCLDQEKNGNNKISNYEIENKSDSINEEDSYSNNYNSTTLDVNNGGQPSVVKYDVGNSLTTRKSTVSVSVTAIPSVFGYNGKNKSEQTKESKNIKCSNITTNKKNTDYINEKEAVINVNKLNYSENVNDNDKTNNNNQNIKASEKQNCKNTNYNENIFPASTSTRKIPANIVTKSNNCCSNATSIVNKNNTGTSDKIMKINNFSTDDNSNQNFNSNNNIDKTNSTSSNSTNQYCQITNNKKNKNTRLDVLQLNADNINQRCKSDITVSEKQKYLTLDENDNNSRTGSMIMEPPKQKKKKNKNKDYKCAESKEQIPVNNSQGSDACTNDDGMLTFTTDFNCNDKNQIKNKTSLDKNDHLGTTKTSIPSLIDKDKDKDKDISKPNANINAMSWSSLFVNSKANITATYPCQVVGQNNNQSIKLNTDQTTSIKDGKSCIAYSKQSSNYITEKKPLNDCDEETKGVSSPRLSYSAAIALQSDKTQFSSSNNTINTESITSNTDRIEKKIMKRNTASGFNDGCHKFSTFLSKYEIEMSSSNLRPRGLNNPSNYCFINAILQTLMGCSPFCNLMKSISKNISPSFNYSRTPAIYTM